MSDFLSKCLDLFLVYFVTFFIKKNLIKIVHETVQKYIDGSVWNQTINNSNFNSTFVALDLCQLQILRRNISI